MASGSTGAPHNIPFPVGADQYALTSDIQAMSSQISSRLTAVDQANQEVADWSAAIAALNAAAA